MLFVTFPLTLSCQCDPALLPEPNHVMLNHLYALSIKVGLLERVEILVTLLTLFIFSVGMDPTNGSLPVYFSPCVGWSDGVKCDSQIQEEICHFSALQAYLNLNLGASECF